LVGPGSDDASATAVDNGVVRGTAEYSREPLLKEVDGDVEAPAALLEGTEAAQTSAILTSLTSDGVAMPSAEMLAAAHGTGDGEAAVTTDVAAAVADALDGGKGADLDAVIESVANGGAEPAQNAGEALASVGGPGVSAWDMGSVAAFHAGPGEGTVEAMQLHPDAVPTAA
jgi:hypothetical protein